MTTIKKISVLIFKSRVAV